MEADQRPSACHGVAVRMRRDAWRGSARLSKPPQDAPIPKSSQAVDEARLASVSLQPARTKPNRPLAPVMSRFQSAWPGSPGRAGWRTRATSGRAGEPCRDRHGRRHLPLEPDGERAQAAEARGRCRPARRRGRECCGFLERAARVSAFAATVPSITSEWPPRYLVAACTRKVGAVGERLEVERRRPGVVDRSTTAPRAWATAAIAGTSCISKVSEPGDSR